MIAEQENKMEVADNEDAYESIREPGESINMRNIILLSKSIAVEMGRITNADLFRNGGILFDCIASWLINDRDFINFATASKLNLSAAYHKNPNRLFKSVYVEKKQHLYRLSRDIDKKISDMVFSDDKESSLKVKGCIAIFVPAILCVVAFGTAAGNDNEKLLLAMNVLMYIFISLAIFNAMAFFAIYCKKTACQDYEKIGMLRREVNEIKEKQQLIDNSMNSNQIMTAEAVEKACVELEVLLAALNKYGANQRDVESGPVELDKTTDQHVLHSSEGDEEEPLLRSAPVRKFSM